MVTGGLQHHFLREEEPAINAIVAADMVARHGSFRLTPPMVELLSTFLMRPPESDDHVCYEVRDERIDLLRTLSQPNLLLVLERVVYRHIMLAHSVSTTTR